MRRLLPDAHPHRLKPYAHLGADLPVTDQAAAEVLSLPVHPALTSEDLDRIVARGGRRGAPCRGDEVTAAARAAAAAPTAAAAPVAPAANEPRTARAARTGSGPGAAAAAAPEEQHAGHGSGRRLRAGLVGLGVMGRNHARILAALDGVEFVGVVVDPAGAPRTGGPLPPGVPVLREVADLLALGVDYAVVACPTALHEEVGLQLAAHDVCALLEKPLAHTPQAARRLVHAFEERGLVAGVGHVERFNPALQQLRAAGGWRRGSWGTSSRSSPGGRGPSRTASPTWGWSRTWPPTTST